MHGAPAPEAHPAGGTEARPSYPGRGSKGPMASAAGGRDADAGGWARRRAAFSASPRAPIRGLNLLAELEALTVLGAGRFEVGVRHALNVFRGAPIAEGSGDAVASPFAGRQDRRHWRARVYEEDAFLLSRMGSSASLALTHALGVAWPHVPAPYRERVEARLAELPDDAIARSWAAAGGAPWWEPPRVAGEQTHFVLDDPSALHDPGIAR